MLWSAFILGFTGSLHCVGMCSPLVMSITSLRKAAVMNRLIYNAGRIFTYAMLGVFVGTFGSLFEMPAIQTIVSFLLGLTLIVMGIAEISAVRIPFLTAAMLRVTGVIKFRYAAFLHRKGALAVGSLGMLNGLLPCGLTYLALAYCFTTETIGDAFLFMTMFGLGTLPAMIGGASVISFLVRRLSLNVSKITMVAMISLGILLIMRTTMTHRGSHKPASAENEIVICR